MKSLQTLVGSLVLVSASASATLGAFIQVPLQNPSASFDQNYVGGVGATINGNTTITQQGGWAVDPHEGTSQFAVYQTTSPQSFSGLDFQLYFTSTGNPDHKLQDVQLSYTTSPAPTNLSGAVWNVLTPSGADALLATATISGTQVLFTGNPALPDMYNIVVDNLSLTGVTGFRLDAFPVPPVTGVLGFSGNGNFVLTQFQVFTPEPSSFVLCGLGAVGLLVAARRRRKA